MVTGHTGLEWPRERHAEESAVTPELLDRTGHSRSSAEGTEEHRRGQCPGLQHRLVCRGEPSWVRVACLSLVRGLLRQCPDATARPAQHGSQGRLGHESDPGVCFRSPISPCCAHHPPARSRHFSPLPECLRRGPAASARAAGPRPCQPSCPTPHRAPLGHRRQASWHYC